MDTQETPLVVYRDHWTPEYITLICGIANAGGGTLVIESNDNIYTTGHRKMRRPFEQIPRIIERDLGIQCTTEPVLDGINLYLEILVPAVAEPLTYEGEYWLYSEATTRARPARPSGPPSTAPPPNRTRRQATPFPGRCAPNPTSSKGS